MQSSEPPQRDAAQCPICRARQASATPFCAVCGTQLDEAAAREEELRSILYLLSELDGWIASGQMDAAQAAGLRRMYEGRRDQLRRKMSARTSENSKQPSAAREDTTYRADAAHTPFTSTEQSQATHAQAGHTAPTSEYVAFPSRPSARTSTPPPQYAPPPTFQRPRRTLFERLAEPRTLRLMLYVGAAMLVVGVVATLRDILYLKLQEPVVQAGLLATGTVAAIASGWYIILRTRQRWTGRALTLAGSLLVPINFWFLVRSGLIADSGRAWTVCLLCALLYAHTAVILRERLYVYMACVASVSVVWALILRDAPRAFGLYALTLMCAALIFLHLSRIFPAESVDAESTAPLDDDDEDLADARKAPRYGRWTSELWSAPLVRTAHAFAAISIFIYAPLRLASQTQTLYDGIFALRSSSYDAGISMLLFAAGAYVLWFTGRYIYTTWAVPFTTAAALMLFLTLWIICDGLRLPAERQLLALAFATFLAAAAARFLRAGTMAAALHYASLIVNIALAVAGITVLVNARWSTFTQSLGFAFIAASFVAQSGAERTSRVGRTALAHFAALYLSAAYAIALARLSFSSETLVTVLCAAWPFALYGAGQLAARAKRETHLAAHFTRVADVEVFLLLTWGAILSLLIHSMEGGASRTAAQSALAACALYGILRATRERSIYGSALGALASVIMAAALLDALRKLGLWPDQWPIAAGTITAAFLLQKAAARFFHSQDGAGTGASSTLTATTRAVFDTVVIVCSLMWLTIALVKIDTSGFSAPAVLLLALLYWTERAVMQRAAWTVYIGSTVMSAFLITLLVALRVDAEWFALLFAAAIPPALFILSRYESGRAWLAEPLSRAAPVALALAMMVALVQALPHMEAGNPRLLAPSLTVGLVALLSLIASIFSRGRASVLYFRAGLWIAPVALMLASLRAGFDPVNDAEVYTTPISLLLLTVAYLSHRRAWQEHDRDVGALLWAGSLLLCVPLLFRALEFRLLLDAPAPWRDVVVLGASLGLVLYGVLGRMRAPVLVGASVLVVDLSVVTLTTVDWLQVPLKYYLISVGALLLVIFGTLEYRREQFLLMRKRLQEQRRRAREEFGEWR